MPEDAKGHHVPLLVGNERCQIHLGVGVIVECGFGVGPRGDGQRAVLLVVREIAARKIY